MKQGLTSRSRRLALSLATALLALGATAGVASAATTTFSNSASIGIPDSGPGSPFPSTINATGFVGGVQKATVTLHGFTHTCPQDLSVLLTSPSGAKSILMGNVGSCPQTDIGLLSLTFDQGAANSIGNTVTVTSGTYKPSEDVSNFEGDLSPPAPAGPYPVTLDAFNGVPGNGTWSLFVQDCCSADQGSIGQGWSLALTAPVGTVTAGKPKLNKKKGTAQVPVTVGDAGTVTLSGKGIKTASANSTGPGTTKLTVKAKGKTSRKLNSTGKAAAKVKITFTATGGTPTVTTKKIKLKKTL